MEYKNRSEVPNEYKWDLTTRYKTDDDWQKDYVVLSEKIKEISKFKGKVVSSADALVNILNKYFEIDEKMGRLYVYAYLKKDEDLGNDIYKAMFDKVVNLYT